MTFKCGFRCPFFQGKYKFIKLKVEKFCMAKTNSVVNISATISAMPILFPLCHDYFYHANTIFPTPKKTFFTKCLICQNYSFLCQDNLTIHTRDSSLTSPLWSNKVSPSNLNLTLVILYGALGSTVPLKWNQQHTQLFQICANNTHFRLCLPQTKACLRKILEKYIRAGLGREP